MPHINVSLEIVMNAICSMINNLNVIMKMDKRRHRIRHSSTENTPPLMLQQNLYSVSS